MSNHKGLNQYGNALIYLSKSFFGILKKPNTIFLLLILLPINSTVKGIIDLNTYPFRN